MQDSTIIIIDKQRYFYDYQNDCMVPIDDFNENLDNDCKKLINIENQTNQTNQTNQENNDNNGNNENNENTENLNEWYMGNFDIDFWENILSRNLDMDEKKIIHGIWNENSLNIDIQVLQKNLIKHNCYIKSITNNVGNCLFESLASLGLGDNDLAISTHAMIRKSLANILLMVKTEVGFFPKINLTPEELFKNINEIEFIKDKTTGQVYEYDYDMMIYDLNSSFSWERLPTEFLLMVVSRIYDVEIRIYHNKTDFVNIINVFDTNDNNQDIVRLGQINEEHYFPLLEIPNELKNDLDVIDEILNTKVQYNQCLNKFKKWSKIMMDSISSNDNFNNNYNVDTLRNINTCDNSNNDNIHIMKSNKMLTIEQIEDYNEISNFDEFDVFD